MRVARGDAIASDHCSGLVLYLSYFHSVSRYHGDRHSWPAAARRGVF